MERQKSSLDFKTHSQSQSLLKNELNILLKGVKDLRKERFAFWEEVVGGRISNVAIPVKNKKGVLFVKVQDAVWRFELTRNKDEIIKKINEYLNKNTIKDIVFI
jgi:predicted nucleic acid-binding Zn ribbon protein